MIKEKIIVILFFIIICFVLLDVSSILLPSLTRFQSSNRINLEKREDLSDTNSTKSYNQISLSMNGWGSDIFHDRTNVYNNWFQLTGITQFEKNYKAIVNGEILSEMDRVRGFTLIKISAKKVVLKRNEYIVTLKLEE